MENSAPLWHVDDLMISHSDPEVVTDVIDRLIKSYGNIIPSSISRGKIHNYLGIAFGHT